MRTAQFIWAAFVLAGLVGFARADDPPATKSAEPTKVDAYGDPLPPGALLRFGTIRLRHDAKAVAFLDDKTIVSVGSSIRFWDAATGQLIRVHRHEKMVDPISASISDDQKRAITRGADYGYRVWDIASGQLIQEFNSASAAKERGRYESRYEISASADGSRFVAREQDADLIGHLLAQAVVYSSERKSEPIKLSTPGNVVIACAMCPDGSRVVTALDPLRNDDSGQILVLWDSASGKRLRTAFTKIGQLYCCRFMPDGKSVILIGDNAMVLQTIDGKEIWRKAAEATELLEIACITSGCVVIEARRANPTRFDLPPGATEIRVLDARSGQLLGRWAKPKSEWNLFAAAVSPDGKRIALSDNRLHVLNLADGKDAVPALEHVTAIESICVTPDCRFVASMSWEDNEVLLWDVASGKIARRLQDHRGKCRSIAFSNDGKLLAASAYDSGTIVWDVATGRQLYKLPDELSICMRFLPDNRRLAQGRWSAGGAVLVHDCPSGRLLKELPGPFYRSNCEGLGFGPDRRLLAVYSSIRMNRAGDPEMAGIDIWNVVAGSVMHHFEHCPTGIYSAAWTRDGRTFAARFDNGEIKLWEMASGRPRWTASQPDVLDKRSRIACRFALSPDDQTLATIGPNKASVDLWDLASGKLFGSITDYDQPIETLEFSPDGRRLFTAYGDATMLAWDMTRPEWHSRPLNHPLTDEEVKRHWDRLYSDADEAYRSKWALVGDPKKTVAFLSTHIASEPRIAAERVKALIADLDSAEYQVRERAQRELQEHFRQAEALLRKTLEGPVSAEVRNRINRMIAGYFAAIPPPDQLRDLRAIEVLEQIGTPEAHDVLRRLAASEAPTRISRDAGESLKRLETRPR